MRFPAVALVLGSAAVVRVVPISNSYRMTLRYAHLSPVHLRAAVDRLDGLTATPAVGRPSPAGNRVPMAHELAQSGILAPQSQVSAS